MKPEVKTAALDSFDAASSLLSSSESALGGGDGGGGGGQARQQQITNGEENSGKITICLKKKVTPFFHCSFLSAKNSRFITSADGGWENE
jgi:hypothetical protein